MSETVSVDREALRNLLYEVDALAEVEALRLGRSDGAYMDHIFRLTQTLRRTIDPRQEFDEGLTDEESDSVAEVIELHARHLFRTLVIEDMLSHA
jgi:hypothetical protein